jgi:hypothetical protein
MKASTDLAAQLRALADRVDDLDPARVAGELEALKFTIWMRTLTVPVPAAEKDTLLTAADVHRQTQLSVAWLYRHADGLPFTRRVGRKVLFSSAGLAKWLAARRP